MNRMSDTISRSDAIEQMQTWAVNLINPKMLSREDAIYILETMPSAQPEIIRCGECVNNFDNRCLQADHHTNDIECCMSVFGAKRRTDE